MLDGLLFLAVLIGTGWLCAWSLQDDRRPKRPWAPFDARHIGVPREGPATSAARHARPAPADWRQHAAKRRGAAGRLAPEPPPWRRRSGS